MGMMNKMGNAKNPYQGDAKKVLTVCSAGLLRSPTAAYVLNRAYGYNTRAAGISSEYALIEVSEVLIYWADEIVFLEPEHLAIFKQRFADCNHAMAMIEHNEYQVLDIIDAFQYGSEKLEDLILEKYIKA